MRTVRSGTPRSLARPGEIGPDAFCARSWLWSRVRGCASEQLQWTAAGEHAPARHGHLVAGWMLLFLAVMMGAMGSYPLARGG